MRTNVGVKYVKMLDKQYVHKKQLFSLFLNRLIVCIHAAQVYFTKLQEIN